MIPVRVGWCATFGGEDNHTVAIGQVHQGIRALFAALCACSCEEEQGCALEWPIDLALVRTKFRNHLVIPVTHVSYYSFYYWCRHIRHLFDELYFSLYQKDLQKVSPCLKAFSGNTGDSGIREVPIG